MVCSELMVGYEEKKTTLQMIIIIIIKINIIRSTSTPWWIYTLLYIYIQDIDFAVHSSSSLAYRRYRCPTPSPASSSSYLSCFCYCCWYFMTMAVRRTMYVGAVSSQSTSHKLYRRTNCRNNKCQYNKHKEHTNYKNSGAAWSVLLHTQS